MPMGIEEGESPIAGLSEAQRTRELQGQLRQEIRFAFNAYCVAKKPADKAAARTRAFARARLVAGFMMKHRGIDAGSAEAQTMLMRIGAAIERLFALRNLEQFDKSFKDDWS